MRWIIVCMLFFVICSQIDLGCAMANPPLDAISPPPDEEYKAGEIMVKFKKGTHNSIRQEMHERLGSTVIKNKSN